MMYKSTEYFVNELDKLEFKYKIEENNEIEEKNYDFIGIEFIGDYSNNISMGFFFEETGAFSVRIYSICKVPGDKIIAMLKTINELNYSVSWVKYVLSQENEVYADADIEISKYDPEYSKICIDFLNIFIDIVNKGYLKLMKCLWDN